MGGPKKAKKRADIILEWSLIKEGTIHKQCRHFFRIFDTPLPHVSSFLVQSFGNFDHFLTLPIADIAYG